MPFIKKLKTIASADGKYFEQLPAILIFSLRKLPSSHKILYGNQPFKPRFIPNF